MQNNTTIIKAKVFKGFFVGAFALATILFAGQALAAGPQVSTLPATAVTQTSMTINGNFTNGTGTTQVRFDYGITPLMGTFTAYQTFTGTNSQFQATLSSLSPGTVYYFRAEGNNGGGIGFGSTLSQSTTSYAGASVQTLQIQNSNADITGTTALLQGWFNGNGSSTSTYFEYANNSSFIGSYTTPAVTQSNASGSFSGLATGLTPNTTYWYRAKATNNSGTVIATTSISFTTTSNGGNGNGNTGSSCNITSFGTSTTINQGGSATLSWNTSNCTSLVISSLGSVAANSSITVYPTSTTTYTLSGVGTDGLTYTSSPVTITVIPNGNNGNGNGNTNACVINSFNASPNIVYQGQSTTLYWSTSNCTSVILTGNNVNGSQSTNGSLTVYPNGLNAIYTLNAYGPNGNPSSTLSISVTNNNNGNNNNYNQCSIGNFSASPYQVTSGGSSMLTWSTQNCSSVSVTGGNLNTYNGNQSLSGSISTGSLYSTTTYTISAYGQNGSAPSQTVSVGVLPFSVITPIYPNNPQVYVPPTTYVPPTQTIIKYVTVPNQTITTTTVPTGTITLGSTVMNNQGSSVIGNNLAGLALWGGGIFPTSLVGLLFLLLIIMLIILIVRRIYGENSSSRGNGGHH